uniref:Cathepsin propeptide inhibitor domain-containing protein n=1 Tax=Aegilops tauschii subsp. strangulata TaxID=200361 RepID=A0A453LT90_AEGTS
MSLPTLIFALLVVSSAVAAPRAHAARELAGNDAIAVDAAMVSRHEKWMAEHGRTYADEEEKARRLEVFRANAKFIDSFNAAEESSHRLATNRFADLTDEEFRAARTGLRPVAGAGSGAGGFRYENFSLADAAGSMDWRAMGAVTGVKDQGSCGTYNQHDNTGTHATADACKLSCRTLQAPEQLPPQSNFF